MALRRFETVYHEATKSFVFFMSLRAFVKNVGGDGILMA
jgi:hypothetical protein